MLAPLSRGAHERTACPRLSARVFHAGQRLTKGSEGDAAVEDAVTALQTACSALTISGKETVLSLVGDAFYLDRSLLANASTEFDSVLQAMKLRRIGTITILPGASRGDVSDLAALLAGQSEDLPAEGTILLNERVLSPSDLEMRPLSTLRRTYAESLDSLRGVSRNRTLHLGRGTRRRRRLPCWWCRAWIVAADGDSPQP